MASTRRLAAILAADLAGYSRLMGADEEGTLERLKAHRRQLIDPKIAEHRGRIVKTTGDGLLAEFASVVDAVRCAAEVQRGMLDREPEVPDERRIRFRIGINLGDVIAEGDDIFGDGVNVAARLEGLAEPGGICVSGMVRDQIRDRLPYTLEDRGEQQALASSPEYPLAHLAKANLLRDQRRCEDAIPEFEQVLAVDRSAVGVASGLGYCKFLGGGSDAEAIELQEQAIRLSPRDPSIAFSYAVIGLVHLFYSRTDEAIPWLEKARRANPKYAGPRWYLACAYGLKGELDRAAAELAEAERLVGSDKYSTIARVRANGPLNTPALHDRFEGVFLVGLRKAGLPEE